MSTNAWCPFRSKALASGVYRWNVQYTNWVEHLSTHESDMPQFVTNENLPAPKARLYPYPPHPSPLLLLIPRSHYFCAYFFIAIFPLFAFSVCLASKKLYRG